MQMFDSKEAMIGASAAMGAAALKFIQWMITRRFSEATQLREELRGEIDRLSRRVQAMQSEVDAWREKFYQINQENLKLKGELADLRVQVAKCQQTHSRP